MSPAVGRIAWSVLRAIMRAGPGIVEALKSDDHKLAVRRTREAAETEIDVAIAKERLRLRKKRRA